MPHTCLFRSLMGFCSSRKTERRFVTVSQAYFKDISLKEHPSLFRDGIHECYNGKAIVHLHIYAYEEASQQHHYICQLVDVATALST